LLTTLGFVRLQIIFNMPNNCQKQHESKKKVGAKAAVKTEESKARTDPTACRVAAPGVEGHGIPFC
jgi:hypothetical protein